MGLIEGDVTLPPLRNVELRISAGMDLQRNQERGLGSRFSNCLHEAFFGLDRADLAGKSAILLGSE
jgi:hypothetical protein